jgi:CubicO group peptidase (beta-lactamase class C family)
MLFTQGVADCSPADVNYDESRTSVLNNHFQTLINDGEIQCASYCVSRYGKVFMHGAVGKKSYRPEDSAPLEPNAVYQIASITKTFTTLAVMKLVEDGVTRLDIPAGEILPQFNTPPFDKITLFHLLTHTSGMHPDTGNYPNKYELSAWDLIYRAYKLRQNKDGEFDWISAALANGVRKGPGEEWMYSSFGFAILGAAIEKLTGVFANKYITDYIIKPLGLKDTGFHDSLTPELAKRFILQDENSENWLSAVINAAEGNGDSSEGNALWSRVPDTSGGMFSTVSDLLRFANMTLYNGTFNGTRIIGRKAMEKLKSRAIFNIPNYGWGANEPDRGYGIGFDMRFGPAFTFSEGTYNHEGAGACSLYVDPAEELAAAWFVPFAKDGWFSRALFNVQNVIWSGLK